MNTDQTNTTDILQELDALLAHVKNISSEFNTENERRDTAIHDGIEQLDTEIAAIEEGMDAMEIAMQ